MTPDDKSCSIYIHYPFCKSKCPYCDFNSHVTDGVNYEQFLQAYESELNYFALSTNYKKVSSIFFGGGTPSLMPVELVSSIIRKIEDLWSLSSSLEITIEANPTSFEAAKFKDLSAIGVNRLSLGIQSFDDFDLKFLGREHSATEAKKVIEVASGIFPNMSFDLIYARPLQTLFSWRKELEEAISFGMKHLSLYQLTIEKGTKFFSSHRRGEFTMPSEELSAEFYQLTGEITAANGMIAYEISNYAKPGFESAHNLGYWQGIDYIGIGAGAHSRVYFKDQKLRSGVVMLSEPNSWLQKVKTEGVGIQSVETISRFESLEELILMGMRLKGGLTNEMVKRHLDLELLEVFDLNALEQMKKQDLIDFSKDFISLTDKSRMLANMVISKLCENIVVGD